MSKRRTFTPEFKAQVVLEELVGIKDKADICHLVSNYVLERLFYDFQRDFAPSGQCCGTKILQIGPGWASAV